MTNGMWMAEWGARIPFIQPALVNLVTSLEALLKTDRRRLKAQFVGRTCALAEELGVEGVTDEDADALHAYKKDADGVLAEVKKARDILADLGAASWELHLTEFGWATGFPPGDHSVGNDERKQARLIKSTYTKLGAQRKKLKIASVNYYAWRDLPPPTDFSGGPDYWGLHTGFLRLDGTAKPALSTPLKASRAIN